MSWRFQRKVNNKNAKADWQIVINSDGIWTNYTLIPWHVLHRLSHSVFSRIIDISKAKNPWLMTFARPQFDLSRKAFIFQMEPSRSFCVIVGFMGWQCTHAWRVAFLQ